MTWFVSQNSALQHSPIALGSRECDIFLDNRLDVPVADDRLRAATSAECFGRVRPGPEGKWKVD